MSITLPFPEGKKLPSRVLTADADEVYEILEIGALVLDTVHTRKADAELQTRILAHQKEVSSLQERFRVDVATLQIASTEAARQREQDALIQQTQMTQALATKDSLLTDMKQRKEALERDVEIQLKRVREEERATLERIIQGKEAELQRVLSEKRGDQERMDVERRNHRDALQQLTDKLQSLTESLAKKPTSMKEKGTNFETDIIEHATTFWGSVEGFAIKNTATRGHTGDVWVDLGTGDSKLTVLLECKDYTGTLPTSQVEKFERNVKDNHAIHVGVLIVRGANITGHPVNVVDFAILEGKLHLYVSHFEQWDPCSLFQTLIGWIRFHTLTQKPSTDVEDKAEAVRIVQKLVEDAQEYKRQLTTHLQHMNDFRLFAEGHAKDSLIKVQTALSALQHGSDTNVVSESLLFQDATGHPAKQKCIEMILSVATEDTGSIKLSDLAKRVAEQSGKTENTVREQIETVLHESVLDKRKGFPTMVRGLTLRVV
jgi:hypothetical protein